MSKSKIIIQSIIGFLPITILWCVGGYFGNIFNEVDEIFSVENPGICLRAVVPLIVVQMIPVLLWLMSVIGKRFNLKALHISAVVGTALPVVSVALSTIFSDDGNILSWIYGFTIGLFLYPFGRMGFGTFDGVDSYYFIYKDGFIEREHIILFYVGVIIFSLILYLVVRTKKGKTNSLKSDNKNS